MSAKSYEICFRGEIPPEELMEIENFHATVQPAQTVLHGRAPDGAALQTILGRLNSLGLEIVEVRRLPGADTIRRISTQRSSPINAPVHASPDGYPPAGDPPVSPKPPSKSEGAAPMMPATTIPPDRQPPAQTSVRGGQGTVHQ